MSILTEADDIINGERAADYGDITTNFQNIVDFWKLVVISP